MLRLRQPKPQNQASALSGLSGVPAESPLVGSDARITAYLDRVDAELHNVSPELRVEMRRELQGHLDASVMAFQELGETPEQVVASALARFGPPEQYCRSLYRELKSRARRTNRRASITYALSLFGGMTAIDVIVATLGMHFLTTPEEWVSKYVPLWICFCIGWLMLGSPFTAGWRVGRETGKQAVRAAFAALLLTCAGLFATYYVLSFLYPGTGGPLRVRSIEYMLVHSLFYCGMYHVVRLPVGLLGAWLGQKPSGCWRRRLRPIQ